MTHWLVIDLEATTDEGGWPVEDMEVIEIGAVIVDANGRELSHFQSFVRPRLRAELTDFCRQLTHIRQSDIDAAPTLDRLWPRLEAWLLPHLGDLQGWLSWGNYDRQQLEVEWRNQQLSSCLASLPHFNLKQLFARHYRQTRRSRDRRQLGLNKALEVSGLSFAGTQHRGLDDARNIARLLPLSLPALIAACQATQPPH
ncbi:exonuclease domain-containing protein [Geopseudomonas guangdongensis]|uniref:Inhibitor of the KinA pathway to sporulation, predicted exonuclease n=1 Tax=Geopseudomonas guangdongensis TaxID=1245526 RepID=A0A1H2HMI4_9GAMM|nr:exonuclease domain-containing protein [Pseudomonas guangdongensis]SDU32966.1 Inhibitor of the KinA pathway to sporulation, predicted exonuclease [Pseudomonas guangdongensis]